MLIWTPLNAAELQLSMHGASLGPAALIPVQSGTVLLFSPRSRQLDALGVVVKVCKTAGTRAVAAVWNSDAAIVYPAVGRVSRAWTWGTAEQVRRLGVDANQHGWFGRWFQRAFGRFFDHRGQEKARAVYLERFAEAAPQVDRDAVAALLRDHHDGVEVVPRVFAALGLPEVAQVCELVDEGRADTRLEQLAPPRLPWWLERGYLWFCLLALVVLVVVTTPLWVKLVLLALLLSFFAVGAAMRRVVVGRKPVNTVLPVIPVTQGAAPTD
ncbi:hypothetical protein ADL03_09760 [Nocardia sp. NRRL S-836]|nr:hypothetical protein ADL03_09760 [Nocardia sp. NRRL S-836]